jgi:membrane protein required for colicin V production
MLIDGIIAICLLLALFRGYSKGVIMAVLSLVGVLLASILSLKLGHTVSQYLSTAGITKSQYALPLSFILIFIAVILVTRLLIKALEGVIKIAMLGWLNKLGGAALYICLNAFVVSLLLWLCNTVGLVTEAGVADTILAKPLLAIAPALMNFISTIAPFLKDIVGKVGAVG